MTDHITLINLIDDLLPQTQCGLCGHAAGCLPYATAIVQGEPINQCVPGGQPVADALAHVLGRERLPAAESVWPVAADGRPQRVKAVIREEECIGCTKCLAACPVDAILGSGKMMHTVIAADCTGCELCIAPCPVDCIDLVLDQTPPPNEAERHAEQHRLRARYRAHLAREQLREQQRLDSKPKIHAAISPVTSIASQSIQEQSTPAAAPAALHTQNAQRTIQMATLRSQIKKLTKQQQLNPDDTHLNEQIQRLQQQLQQWMT